MKCSDAIEQLTCYIDYITAMYSRISKKDKLVIYTDHSGYGVCHISKYDTGLFNEHITTLDCLDMVKQYRERLNKHGDKEYIKRQWSVAYGLATDIFNKLEVDNG